MAKGKTKRTYPCWPMTGGQDERHAEAYRAMVDFCERLLSVLGTRAAVLQAEQSNELRRVVALAREAKRTAEHRVWSLESNERIQRADVDSAARALADSLLERYDADMLPVASTSEVAAYRRVRVMWEDTWLALHEARQALKEFKS